MRRQYSATLHTSTSPESIHWANKMNSIAPLLNYNKKLPSSLMFPSISMKLLPTQSLMPNLFSFIEILLNIQVLLVMIQSLYLVENLKSQWIFNGQKKLV